MQTNLSSSVQVQECRTGENSEDKKKCLVARGAHKSRNEKLHMCNLAKKAYMQKAVKERMQSCAVI